ncbi:FHIPEP family type III secretion protein [Bradyrhizobium sp. SSUT18]|uniref:FHIPEP family type III secretion protein n=1 Tax=Bradyrhizobium sp. SSUT18 TaxID=3040602 RepID=UPI00326484DC
MHRNLTHAIDKGELEQCIGRVSALVSADLGITIPRIPAQLDQRLSESQFRVDVEGVPVEADFVDPAQLMLNDDVANIELSGIPFRQEPDTNRIWIEQEHESRSRKSAQDAKWSFCLTAGTIGPANQERP